MNTRSVVNNIGVPRLVIVGFFFLLCIASVPLKLNLPDLISNVLVRVGMNGILVLSMVPSIKCGIGLNFGFAIGIVGGILGGLIAIEMEFKQWTAIGAAIVIGLAISSVSGYLYGLLLNRVKGSEMTVSTYVGFSTISLFNIGWLLFPFSSPRIVWPIAGDGLRNTITIEGTFDNVLIKFLTFNIGRITIPAGALLLLALACLSMYLFLNSRTGMAMSAAGSNPQFARAAGINVDKMRILGTTVSTACAALGIIAYAQCFGFIQLYNAPLYMSFSAVAAVLIGGASISNARIFHVILGVILFQGIISMGLPVANKIIPEGNLSEVMRLIISNGIILYALTKAKGGSDNA